MKTFNAAFIASIYNLGIGALCLLAASHQMRFARVWDSFDTFMALFWVCDALVFVCVVIMVRALLTLRR